LFAAIVSGDGRGAGRLMLERARRSECRDPEAFVSSIAALVHTVTGLEPPEAAGGGAFARLGPLASLAGGLRLSTVQVGELLGQVLGLCCAHGVLLEQRFATVVCAIAVLEGVGRSLDPDLDILREAAPVVFAAAARKAARNAALPEK
jgi:aarF domain-containing kinase